jgi:hypothetical protein
MVINNEQDLLPLQLRFIGKIIAGFTHETKNYLAIINESVGLIGDMVKIGKPSQENISAYLEIIHSIEDQIKRTNTHFSYLNRFAHRMDTQLSSFNVNESLEELIALLRRFANLKRLSLEKDFQEDIPPIYSNPSIVQFVVFSFLEEWISKLDKNSKITIGTAFADNTIKIRIIPEGNVISVVSDKPSIPYEILKKILKQLNGNILQESDKETVIMLAMTVK